MRSTFAPLLVCASFVGVALGQALIINTPVPAPVTCEPTLITWGGGSPPYIVNLVDADDQTNQLFVFGTGLTTTQLTWNVNVTAGTNCILFIKDNTGLSQNSAPFTIQPGPTNCFGSSSSASAPPSSSSGSAKPSSTPSSTKASSTPPVTISTTTPSVTPSVTPSSTKPVSSLPASSGSPSASAPSSSSTGAARATGVPAAAAAAALGAVFAALL